MFFGALGGNVMINTSILSLRNLLNSTGILRDPKRCLSRRTVPTTRRFVQSRSTSLPRILSTRSSWILYKGVVLGWAALTVLYLVSRLPWTSGRLWRWSTVVTHTSLSTYPDPTGVLDTIIDDEKIIERAASVTRAYDDFINAAQEYGTGNWWKEDWKDLLVLNGHCVTWSVDSIVQSWTCTSWGYSFLCFFACSFALVNSKSWKAMQRSSVDCSWWVTAHDHHHEHDQELAEGWWPWHGEDHWRGRANVVQMFRDCVEEEKNQ